jgi:hypothetical protein
MGPPNGADGRGADWPGPGWVPIPGGRGGGPALGPVGGYLEEVGFPVDWWILMGGSIWSAVVGWILLRLYRMIVRLLDDLGVPILMGLERTVNSVADLGGTGKIRLVLQKCRGLVSGRRVQNLTFPHSWLTGEDSTRGLVLVALGARAADALSSRVGSGVLAGMARMLVWTLPLSATARQPMRSYPQHPVSGPGKNQQRV